MGLGRSGAASLGSPPLRRHPGPEAWGQPPMWRHRTPPSRSESATALGRRHGVGHGIAGNGAQDAGAGQQKRQTGRTRGADPQHQRTQAGRDEGPLRRTRARNWRRCAAELAAHFRDQQRGQSRDTSRVHDAPVHCTWRLERRFYSWQDGGRSQTLYFRCQPQDDAIQTVYKVRHATKTWPTKHEK